MNFKPKLHNTNIKISRLRGALQMSMKFLYIYTISLVQLKIKKYTNLLFIIETNMHYIKKIVNFIVYKKSLIKN